MNCPLCNVNLQITERQGIEIDYCPTCRGVWLDRGELDKIIERSNPVGNGSRTNEPFSGERDCRDKEDYDDRDDPKRKRHRGGFLGELFDFGD
ncbi:MAG: zf-TFIIB domain-containing protein [Armatimonadetes bacterium]|nr:zf-TFIIB domain-containing protein [Armatimonadota bacterium]